MNKKRTVDLYKKSLGTFRLSRADILALEDIIRKHMKRHDEILKKHLRASHNGKPEEIDKAEFSDTYLELNRSWHGGRGLRFFRDGFAYQMGVDFSYNCNSIRDIPDGVNIPYLKIVGKPGVYLTFSPLKTELAVRRQDASNEERASMDMAIRRIEAYLARRKATSFFNRVLL